MWLLIARAEGVDEFVRDIFGDFENVVALVLSFQRGTPNAVNGLALLVHYVVVFEQVFAGVEVLRFDRLLRVLYAARNELGLDGHAFRHAQTVHQRLHAFAAEDAHEIVFEREEEARRTRVALTDGASAQLIVDAAGFVAFGAENVQAAELDDLVVLGLALIGKLVVDGLPLIGGDLKNLAFVLE